jgi:hypothetical protein
LSAWVLNPDSNESNELKSHVESCAECRAQVQPISRLIAALRHPVETNPRTAHSPGGIHLRPDQRQRYVILPAAELSPIWRDHVKECDECRGAILLLRARRAAENMSSIRPSGTDSVLTENVIVPIKASWRNSRFALPAALAAGFFLAVLIRLPIDRVTSPESFSFNTTAESPTLFFSTQQPSTDGLGFVNAQHSVPFKGLVMSAEAGAITVRWDPVPEASLYSLHLYLVQGLTQVDVFRGETTTNSLRLPREILSTNETYRWELGGSTRNQLRFGVGGTLMLSSSLPLE